MHSYLEKVEAIDIDAEGVVKLSTKRVPHGTEGLCIFQNLVAEY